MEIDLSTISKAECYQLITQAIIPRPIAWVLTDNGSGDGLSRYNLAPFSFFNAVSAEPPLVMLSFSSKNDDGVAKDTWANLLARKKCTIHLANIEQLDDLIDSSASLPHGESELLRKPYKLVELVSGSLPRLENTPIAMAAQYHSHVNFTPDNSAGVVFCQINHIYIKDDICKKDYKNRLVIDPSLFNPPSRLGGANYATIGNVLTKKRP